MMSQTPVFTYVRVQKKYLYQDMPPTDFEPMTPSHKRGCKRKVVGALPTCKVRCGHPNKILYINSNAREQEHLP